VGRGYDEIVPMKATSDASLPTDGGEWAYEIKWDGYRIIAVVEDGAVRLHTRNLLDATADFPEVAGLGEAVAPHDAVLDGEMVAIDEHGLPSFGALQQRGTRRPHVVYMVFDLLALDGTSTVRLPYVERRRLLEGLGIDAGPAWQVPRYSVGDGEALLAATRSKGLEGLVAKRLDSVYEPGRRARSWRKIKNWGRQELVVGGWMPGKSGRAGRLGSLLVGYYGDDGALHYAGRVGTGFTDAELTRLEGLLAPLARPTSPFATGEALPREVRKQGRFVDPVLVAEVAFSEWTHTGTIRQPAYKGLRRDKDAREVVREG
jgi:bifunctional non-homologous end joining protein LigD